MEKRSRLVPDDCYFDRLPDDIAVSIVDRLGWKDAAKTSLLSHRFQTIWKTCVLYKKNLKFEESTMRELSRMEFVKFVSHILHIHEGPKVDSLRVAFHGQGKVHPHVRYIFMVKVNDGFKNWVSFARAKCVQSLDIDIYHLCAEAREDFPIQLDGWDKALTSLSLSAVHVNDADLEHALKSHLVNLESLVIKHAPCLEQVVVASPKLNLLEIAECEKIRRIDITSAPNLQCFKHQGFSIAKHVVVHFRHVPKLSRVLLGNVALTRTSWSELQKAGMLEKLEMRYCPQFVMFGAWDKLTSLSLRSVGLDDVELERGLKRFLCNLESLFIEEASSLERIVVESVKLKKLVITSCHYIRSINIVSAPNLQCFDHHYGMLEDVEFNHVPKLSHVSFYKVAACPNILSKLQKVESLERLEIEIITPRCKNSQHVGCVASPPHFPLLRNLQELQCHFWTSNESSVMLMIVTLILDACPKLHKLTLDYRMYHGFNEDDEWFDVTKDGLRDRSSIHHCLKEVEFLRQSQHEDENEVEVVKYLKRVATNLKRFTYAEPRFPC